MWVFWGWGKMREICMCTFLTLLKCQKYTSEKVSQVSLFITTFVPSEARMIFILDSK